MRITSVPEPPTAPPFDFKLTVPPVDVTFNASVPPRLAAHGSDTDTPPMAVAVPVAAVTDAGNVSTGSGVDADCTGGGVVVVVPPALTLNVFIDSAPDWSHTSTVTDPPPPL